MEAKCGCDIQQRPRALPLAATHRHDHQAAHPDQGQGGRLGNGNNLDRVEESAIDRAVLSAGHPDIERLAGTQVHGELDIICLSRPGLYPRVIGIEVTRYVGDGGGCHSGRVEIIARDTNARVHRLGRRDIDIGF